MDRNEQTSAARLISERADRTWIPGCPVAVKKTRVTEKDGVRYVTVTAAPCGTFDVVGYTADVAFSGRDRQPVGVSENVPLTIGESAEIPIPFDGACYVSATVRTVDRANGTWTKPDGAEPVELPEQAVFWQTDPLYETIRRECRGVVSPDYQPDEPCGGWRCACGQINLTESDACGACGCSRTWLRKHLDRDYLAERAKETDEKPAAKPKSAKRKQKNGLSDGTKAAIILSSAVLVITLIVMTFTTFIPKAKCSHAMRLADEGHYDEAIGVLTRLEGYGDSRELLEDVNIQKAKALTGLDSVYLTTTAECPWFSIKDGTLSFNRETYEKSGGQWGSIVIPDVVDGTVVRSLDRNFFINCKDLVAAAISDCVETIGEQAFYNCSSLTDVTFGKNVRTIEQRSFIGCTSLETLTIPDTVTSLGVRAFNNCTSLRRIVLGQGITSIGDYTFSCCTSLKSVTFSSPVTSVGAYAFSDCTALETIFCRFPESEWIEPALGEENDAFRSAALSYDN